MLQPGLPQAGPDLLAAGGEDVVVELELLLVGQRDVSVEPRLHRPGAGVRPALPEVDAKQETDDKLPHCLSNSEHFYVLY